MDTACFENLVQDRYDRTSENVALEEKLRMEDVSSDSNQFTGQKSKISSPPGGDLCKKIGILRYMEYLLGRILFSK
jgi:hypothetical protein